MDLQLLSKGLDFCKKRKKWVLLFALFGASSYGVFRVCRLPSVRRKRRRLLKLFTALFSVAELVSDSAESIGVVSRDMKEFLNSDSDEIPKSLRQISKVATSDEVCDSLTRVSQALTVGILRAYRSEMKSDNGVGSNVNLTDKIMDKVLSSAGTGFVSVVAGSFARNLIRGFYSDDEYIHSSNGNSMVKMMNERVDSSSVPKWVNVICADQCRDLMANCIQVFVGTAVAVYLDKTLGINAFDEIFAGLTNPSHETKMREILVSVCNGAVETLVKTSHDVLTSNNTRTGLHSSLSCSSGVQNEETYANGFEFRNGHKDAIQQEPDESLGGGLGSMVMSTLSVPSNRRFVLDVTGRVTYETVRSMAEFLQMKLYDGMKRSSSAIHDRVVDRGRQAVRYFGWKSYVCVIICFVLLVHIICSTRALLPA